MCLAESQHSAHKFIRWWLYKQQGQPGLHNIVFIKSKHCLNCLSAVLCCVAVVFGTRNLQQCLWKVMCEVVVKVRVEQAIWIAIHNQLYACGPQSTMCDTICKKKNLSHASVLSCIKIFHRPGSVFGNYFVTNLLLSTFCNTLLLTLTVLVTTIDAQWEGMGDVGSARYEPALLPPCPTIRVLSYSN